MADVTYVTFDTAPSIFGALTNSDGTAFDLTDAATVRFQMRLTADRRFKVSAIATIVGSPTAGEVRYDWQTGDLDTAGAYTAHWLVTFDDSSIEHSWPANTITIEPA